MISQRMVRQGHFLFRCRSYLPLVFTVPLAASLWDFQYLNGSHFLEQFWLWFCFVISSSGLLVRATTVGFVPGGTSGRNTHRQIADTLNRSGWYSLCRNPLYLGNYLMGLGFVVSTHDVGVTVIYTAAFWLYYERIIAAEEEFLVSRFGAAYVAWAGVTPVFLPALRGWRTPDLPFSLRTVLRREYPALLLLGCMFLILNVAEGWAAERQLRADLPWVIVFAVCGLSFLTLRTLKKQTQLLQVRGR